jgi:hypothetical protein
VKKTLKAIILTTLVVVGLVFVGTCQFRLIAVIKSKHGNAQFFWGVTMRFRLFVAAVGGGLVFVFHFTEGRCFLCTQRTYNNGSVKSKRGMPTLNQRLRCLTAFFQAITPQRFSEVPLGAGRSYVQTRF